MNNDEMDKLRKFLRGELSQWASACFLRELSTLTTGDGIPLGTSKRFPPKLFLDAFMKHREN